MNKTVCIYPKDESTDFLSPLYDFLCEKGCEGWHKDTTENTDEAYALIKAELVDKKLDNYYSNFIIEERVSRSDIEINAINDRVPLNEIKNLNDWEKGYDAGIKYWIKGDELRKSGNYYL